MSRRRPGAGAEPLAGQSLQNRLTLNLGQTAAHPASSGENPEPPAVAWGSTPMPRRPHACDAPGGQAGGVPGAVQLSVSEKPQSLLLSSQHKTQRVFPASLVHV